MNRKTIKIKLSDGHDYIFSERNKEDSDYSSLQDKLRAHRIKFIQENVKDIDNQMPLMMTEMSRIYSPNDIGIFVSSDPEQLKHAAYDSFKIENPAIPFEKFSELIKNNIRTVIKLINELEADEPAPDKDIAAELKIKVELLDYWKIDHPGVYEYARRNVKKKEVESPQQ